MRVLEGHITATEKKHIKAILDADLEAGKIGRKTYYLKEENGVYTVRVKQMGRGLMPVPGSELREQFSTSKFTI